MHSKTETATVPRPDASAAHPVRDGNSGTPADGAVSDNPPRSGLLDKILIGPILVSLGLHLILLFSLAVIQLNLKRPQSVQRAAVIADTLVDIRKDIFESVDWEVEDAPTLRDPGGGLKSLSELEQESSLDEMENAVSGLAALTGDRGLSSNAGTGGNSLAEGLGDGGGIGAGTADFFGTTAKGKSIVYVIDRSYSMNNNRAMRLAVDELLRSLKSLGPLMEFQVIFYNTEPTMLDLPGRGMVRASPGNLERARQQILSVSPKGGTDHVKALRRALDLNPDIVMFLTDAEDISKADIETLTRRNQRKQRNREPATINVIQFHHDSERLPVTTSETLAKANTGTYRLIETSGEPK